MREKLVRDKIPDLIIESGKNPEYYVESDKEKYEQRLFDKMREELQEFADNPCIEEAADMYEVWFSIIRHWNMLPIDVISCANKKRSERGGFTDRIVLQKIDIEE